MENVKTYTDTGIIYNHACISEDGELIITNSLNHVKMIPDSIDSLVTRDRVSFVYINKEGNMIVSLNTNSVQYWKKKDDEWEKQEGLIVNKPKCLGISNNSQYFIVGTFNNLYVWKIDKNRSSSSSSKKTPVHNTNIDLQNTTNDAP
jgi:hypothetical protein